MEKQLKNTLKQSPKIKQLMNDILALRFTNLDADESACVELLSMCEAINYAYGIAYACAYLGDCFIGKGKNTNAGPQLMRAKNICEEFGFLFLLGNVYNWLGIYYEMQDDRQMAMHCYLDALDLAQQEGDFFKESILLNNIASQFQNSESYALAKEYYIKSYEVYNKVENVDITNPHYAQMTANIISLCCFLNEPDTAFHYYELLKRTKQTVDNQNQIYLCELLINTTFKDLEATRKSIDRMLDELNEHPKNINQFFATFLIVTDSLIKLKEADYTYKILDILDRLCSKDEYANRLKVQYKWMDYYKQFGTEEEKNRAYKRFYELRQLSDNILNKNLADGLLSKIKLRESLKKNKEMKREKERLEDEICIDELTQAYNRRTFRLHTEQFKQNKQIDTISYIMIDVDYFKQYNDTYGHAAGDQALCSVTQCFHSGDSDHIYFYRYGGDEFIGVCLNLTLIEVESYIKNATNRLHNMNIEHKSSLCCPQLSLSIGYSFHTRENHDFYSKIFSEADHALYRAKEFGRNCCILYSSEEYRKH